MSTNLFWKKSEPLKWALSKELKSAISRYIFSSDGSIATDWVVVGFELVPFLYGVAYTNQPLYSEAIRVIDLIKKYGEIELAIL